MTWSQWTVWSHHLHPPGRSKGIPVSVGGIASFSECWQHGTAVFLSLHSVSLHLRSGAGLAQLLTLVDPPPPSLSYKTVTPSFVGCQEDSQIPTAEVLVQTAGRFLELWALKQNTYVGAGMHKRSSLPCVGFCLCLLLRSCGTGTFTATILSPCSAVIHGWED